MASDDRLSVFVEPLPAKPNLEMQQKRAKDLLRAAWAGEAEALARVRALHPKPPDPDALKLADAQLVVARGYGFESWADLRRKIEALTRSPKQSFFAAVRSGDVARARELLAAHAEVREAINEPAGAFGGRPIHMAKRNLAMIDLLIEYGADLNLKSQWSAGGFGILEGEWTSEEVDALVSRGAVIDVFGAAKHGRLERLQELVDGDPSLVHARGGDGKTPLHWASTLEVAQYLIDKGADIDARDVDHQSTPAQYLVRDAPDVTRLLLARGAWFDIFIAVALRDRPLIERSLREDPEALDHRTWHGKYTTVHQGQTPIAAEMGGHRGDVYRWVFGHNVTALDAAAALGYSDIVDLLLQHATPAQRLLAACTRGDRARAEAIVAAHPDVVKTLEPEQLTVIVDRAHANDTAGVMLMLDLGFDPLVRGIDEWEPVRWAAFHGNAVMLERLLRHNPPINVPDPSYGGTPLGQCVYGSLHGWSCHSGDFARCVHLLLDAGERPDPSYLPTGRDDVDAVLRAHFARRAEKGAR
jgi:ankyrin repeat protein